MKSKSIDTVHISNPDNMETIKSNIRDAQNKLLVNKNKNCIFKIYEPGEKGYLRRNKRLGNKLDKKYLGKIIQKDLGTCVLIDKKKSINLICIKFSLSEFICF